MVTQNDARFAALPVKWNVRASMKGWLERAFARAVESMTPLELTATADEKKRLEAEHHAEKSETELHSLKDEGQKVASILEFNEELTRQRFIDAMLIESGWDVGANGQGTGAQQAWRRAGEVYDRRLDAQLARTPV